MNRLLASQRRRAGKATGEAGDRQYETWRQRFRRYEACVRLKNFASVGAKDDHTSL
jgi:hypothetical protein